MELRYVVRRYGTHRSLMCIGIWLARAWHRASAAFPAVVPGRRAALGRVVGSALLAGPVLLLALAPSSVAQQVCPGNPPVTVTSPAVPVDVCIPSGFGGNPIDFFDDFSWRSFVALVWPALGGERGTPDPAKTVGGAGPRVFETYKMLHEVFHPDGSAPTAWNSYDPPQFNACNVQMGFGDLVLASFSKFSNLGQAGFGSLVGPLVAQNGTYVRYETAFNASEFAQIVAPKWYLRASLPPAITFQNGSIDIKSAWVDMGKLAHAERYYTRMAWVLDPTTGSCLQKQVGLVGLHIVQKTPSRPQWIWSTFEQVDNVPPPQQGAPGSFGFNDASGAPMPSVNPYSLDTLPAEPTQPFNVTRITPVHPSTQATNARYQAALAGTPWRFYQLTMTQWPLAANRPATPGTPPNTFPGTGATSAFANSTLETFDQGNIRNGCMNCHNVTRGPTDFLWSLADHAFPANVPGLRVASPGVRALRELLTNPPQTAGAAAQLKAMQELKAQPPARR